MDTQKQKVGKMGEDLACSYFQDQGFAVICRNYWKPWGEIDVVVQKGNDLRFVEVKAVTRDYLPVSREAFNSKGGEDYEPEDNVHPWKRKRLRRVIETYLLDKDLADEIDWQVDILSVYLTKEGTLLKIEHLEDIAL